MTDTWQQTAIIAQGGTVFNIAPDRAGRVWISTDAGIFSQTDEGWRPLAQGQPFGRINTLAWAATTLFAGGGQGQIVYSPDQGQQWYRGRVSQTDAAVACLVAGPNFRKKGVILAGTDGGGILRSTDGGRNWQLANFGLQEFSVMALAVAPTWERREMAFAATTHGFYRSPNGGRAWKKSDAGLAGAAVQSIAVSPNFTKDRTILAGTESQGIFRSTDGGKSWQAWSQGLIPAGADEVATEELPPVNSLWLHPDFAANPVCVAATGDGQLFRSADGGPNWQRVAAADAALLSLGGSEQALYAGLYDRGLLRSTDTGQSWSPVANLAVRPISRLAGNNQILVAFGPLAGAWGSTNGGERWSQLESLTDLTPLLAVAASPGDNFSGGTYSPRLLAATQSGLYYSADGGERWQNVLPAEEVVTFHFSDRFNQDGQVWAGTGGGKLFASNDGGQTWEERPAPKPGIPLVALAQLTLPHKRGRNTLASVTYDLERGQMTLWRSEDGGSSWQQWQQVSGSWPVAHVNLAGQTGDRVLICLDRRAWCSTAAGWERVLETEQPILRLVRLEEERGLLALTARQVLFSPDGVTWSPIDEGLAGETLLDLYVGPAKEEGQLATVLTTGGVVWQRRF
jgi:photosystem II stability/assembly factor-like uncharacterized protein